MSFILALKELPDRYLLFATLFFFAAIYVYLRDDAIVRFLDMLIGGFLTVIVSRAKAPAIETMNVENVENVEGDQLPKEGEKPL